MQSKNRKIPRETREVAASTRNVLLFLLVVE